MSCVPASPDVSLPEVLDPLPLLVSLLLDVSLVDVGVYVERRGVSSVAPPCGGASRVIPTRGGNALTARSGSLKSAGNKFTLLSAKTGKLSDPSHL